MPTDIIIKVDGLDLPAVLDDTDCARAVAAILPMAVHPNTWGEEYYFEVAADCGLDETATVRVAVGDIGYWPPGRAVAVFFGRTPMSTGDDPVPASEVNIIGRITGDAALLKQAPGPRSLKIEKAG